MAFKWVLFFALFAFALARPDSGYDKHHSSEEDSRSYEFEWQVQHESDELDFGHKEHKTGGKVGGYYYVLLPDTRTKKVTYYVEGDSGFVADVTYSGEAEYDSHEESKEYKKYNK